MKFHSGEIAVQERAGVRDIAEDVGEGIADHLPPGAGEFLERRQMAVLGTVDTNGRLWASVVTGDPGFIATDKVDRGADVSHKGGNPGFVRVLDEHRIAFPDYNGNSMFNTLGNLTDNPHAGLLFIDFDTGRTLQLTGRASLDWSPKRVRTFPAAERVID